MVAVDVNRLGTTPHDPERERIIRLYGLRKVDNDLVVTVVQLRRADQRVEARWVDAIDEALDREVDVVAEFLVNPGNTARDARHGTEDGGPVGRILTQRPIAGRDRGQYRSVEVALVAQPFLDIGGNPGLDGNRRQEARPERDAAAAHTRQQQAREDQHGVDLSHPPLPFLILYR